MMTQKTTCNPPPDKINAEVIVKNSFFNLLGRYVPMAIALVVVPILVKGYGTDRYGLLSLSWVIIGYFGLLDMGIGRATTKFVADRMATNDTEELPSLVWTSWSALAGLGCLAAIIIALLAPILVNYVLKIPPYFRSEATTTMYLLALFMPFALCIAGIQGVLEAMQRFDLINAVQVPSGVVGYLIPLAALQYTQDLSILMATLLLARIAVFGILFLLCLRSMPLLKRYQGISVHYLKEILRFGGWLTLSNIISPLMVSLDRFLIGSLVTISAVAYYTAPYSIVTQLWVIPNSLVPVLFPVFSGMAAKRSQDFAALYHRAVKFIFFIVMIAVVPISVMANDLMSFWIGADFAAHSSAVLALLAVGVLINSLAMVPFAVIQASGRPDITAKFHLLELIPYCAMVWWGTITYGIVGTAIAWVLRMTIDAALLFWAADRIQPKEQRGLSFIYLIVSVTVVLYGMSSVAAGMMGDVISRGVSVFCIMGLAVLGFWRYWCCPEEKAMLSRYWTTFKEKFAFQAS